MSIEQSFNALLQAVLAQQQLLQQIATNLSKIESIGGGGGSASIEDYESGKLYKRNMLLVDPMTETVYRVVAQEYTSDTVANDFAAGMISLVGFASQIVTFPHDPSQAEIDALEEDTLVAVYNPNDAPYTPDT